MSLIPCTHLTFRLTSFQNRTVTGNRIAAHRHKTACLTSHLSLWRGHHRTFRSCRSPTLKAKVLDGEEVEVLPHVQTLRKYPIELLSGKVVMVRFDSSILIDQDDTDTAFLTIKYLYNAGARVILASGWTVKREWRVLSVDDVAELLSSAIQLKVVPALSMSQLEQLMNTQPPSADIILFQNLSVYKEDRANDSDFCKKLASGVDVFVNDSFSTAHKILASTVGVTQFCHASVAGFYLEECLTSLQKIIHRQKSPYVAVIGGHNVADKVPALRFLASVCDGLVFVGMMAFQIMYALGDPVPSNLIEREGHREALKVVQFAKQRGIPVLLPQDFWCKHNNSETSLENFPAHNILEGWEPLDLGPKSLDVIASFLSGCKEVIWIGSLKFKHFDQNSDGSLTLALMLDDLSQKDTEVTVVGHKACQAVKTISRCPLAYNMIENASVVWEFLKGRKLHGVMALDRAYPFSLDWEMIYADHAQPLAVDIGSGNGLFLFGMATIRKDMNFLGLESNKKLVSRCLDSVRQSGLKNLHFIATNATSTFRSIVSGYPGPLTLVSIQCPNPDFNQPEHRWRMVQSSLTEAIADLLSPDGKVFLQSDVEEVAVRMRKQFLEDGKGKLNILQDGCDASLASSGWLKENPFRVQSDWERHVLARGAPMFRLMLSSR